MEKRKEQSKHTEAYIVIAAVLLVLAYIYFKLNANANGTSGTSSNTIPTNTNPVVSPLSPGVVNVNFQNQSVPDGVTTYIPLFGFLRFGPSYG